MDDFLLNCLLGLVCCWAIGALCKNARYGLYALAALLTGIVGGELYRHFKSCNTDNEMTVNVSSQNVNDLSKSTVLFYNAISQYETLAESGVLSQINSSTVTFSENTRSVQQRGILLTGLSPPVNIDSS